MDEQVTAGALACAIRKATVGSWLLKQFVELRRQLTETTASLKPGMGPEDANQFEYSVEMIVREQARSFVEWFFNSLEPSKVDGMPRHVDYQGQSYRRLNQKTAHAKVLTRSRNITLLRATWRQGRRGRTISPLEKILGIEFGATPGARDLVGRQIATAGSSQSRCIDVIAERTGARIGPEKLRHLSSYLAETMEPQREACQVKQLDEWLDGAVKRSKNVTLAVSRDGVSLGIALFGHFEIASVATLSIYRDGERLGTIYLACGPEDNQETLSRNFTSLLTSIIRSRDSKLRRIVYVSDAGKIETAYWKNVPRHLYVDGQRVRIQRIVDYYHASRWLGPSDAVRHWHAEATWHQSRQRERRADSEAISAPLSKIYELLRISQPWQSNRQRHCRISVQADRNGTPETVRHSLVSRRSSENPDSAVDPFESNLARDV